MNPEHAKAIGEFLLGNIAMEAATTKKVLAAVPDGHGEYTPDDKSMKALDLVWHIASAEVMLLNIAVTGTDPAPPERVAGTETVAGIVAWYESNLAETLAKVKALSGEQLARVISVWGGAFTMPAVNFISLALNHGIHHRGQLSAYLRPMGAKVPGIYGPSADEPMKG